MSAHILVVDDDPNIRSMMKLVLEMEGYEVTALANGAEALAEIARRAPSALLLDLQMPVVDGRQVVQRLREQGRWVPTVIMTAEHAAQAAARELGVDACLPKPFSLDDLFRTLEQLGRRASRS